MLGNDFLILKKRIVDIKKRISNIKKTYINKTVDIKFFSIHFGLS